MANYANIKDTINQNIKTNGNQQITGQVLQNVLNAIVDNLTAGYLMVGIATEDGNPGTPDQNLCWLATQGTYTNYGNITVESGKLAVIKYNGTWTSDTVDVQGAVTAGDGIAISDEGAVSVRTGTGVKIDEEGNVAADLVAGDYISIEGNKISCTLDANPFYFVDALPDSPVPGTENKVYVVPNSEGTRGDLYQWDAETSAFNKVGEINFTFDPSNLMKKNEVNEADGPTTLSADAAYQLGLRNMASKQVGIDFDNGAGDSINQLVVKSKADNPATDSYVQLLLNGGDNVLTFDSDGLHVGNLSQSQRVLPTILLISNADHDFFDRKSNSNVNTFTYRGIYNLLASIYANKYKLRIVGQTATFDAEVAFIFKSSDIQYSILYQKGKFMYSAEITNDDTVTVYPVYAYTRRYLAAAYGISLWYNASGTSLDLYNDLRSLIEGENNVEGTLGFLCDGNNTFVITGINITTSGSITTLTVSFTEANSQCQNTLIIDSTGALSVMRWPKLEVLWADNYNLIASGMPRPDAWLVADGTDVSFYKVVAEAYKNGYNLILKEYSYGSSSCNQYTVKNIIPGGTGYSLFYESGGRQYMLTINANGSMSTVCNTFSAIDIGVDTFYPTSNKSYSGLTDFATQFIRLAQSGMPVFLKTKNNKFSTSEDVLVPIMNVIWSSGSVTAYYLQVVSSGIGRFSIYVTSNGSVTINTLG